MIRLSEVFIKSAVFLCLILNLFVLAIFTFLAVIEAIYLFRFLGISIAIFLLYFSFIIAYLFIGPAIKAMEKKK